MNKDLKYFLKEYVEQITQKSKGANMYVCPLCGSGTGHNHTGAFSIKDDTQWKCFACDKGGDIFDLVREHENIQEFKDQQEYIKQIFNINNPLPIEQESKEETATKDYTDFFLQANKNINQTTYHRGISLKTLNKFKIGYIEQWKHPKTINNNKVPFSPRLIIPTSKHSYLARDTRDDIPQNELSYAKSKVGEIHIFNIKAIKKASSPIYIVEGEIDALSIIDVGGEAIALGSVTSINKFIEECKKNKPQQYFILALDNDKSGEEAMYKLEEAFKRLKIASYRFNVSKGYKDPNEALKANRNEFRRLVEDGYKILEKQKEEAKKEYYKIATSNYINSFIDGISESVNTPCISTGFKALDDILEGGLYEGLYIIGAMSSVGKTTFVNQITDQIAQSEQDILIFSLEMARNEIMAKSISRHTIEIAIKNGINTRNAKTTRGITIGKRYEKYNKEELQLIDNAILQYGKYAKNIYIYEGVGDIGINQVREKVQEHITITGNNPIVVIDYLQILAPYNDKYTDKQNTDKAVIELKRISRDYKIPVIAISSFNRQNYKKEITMEAFKESGAIEYSSDVLIGLQEILQDDTDKSYTSKLIKLKVLKNRQGRKDVDTDFIYYPMFNYFMECGNEQ